MRQLAFFGFFFGPIGLGLAIASTLRTLGEPKLAKRFVIAGVLFYVLEVIVISIVWMSIIYFHLAGAIMAKLCYDKWIIRLATAHKEKGGHDGEFMQTLFFSGLLTILFLGIGTLFYLIAKFI